MDDDALQPTPVLEGEVIVDGGLAVVLPPKPSGKFVKGDPRCSRTGRPKGSKQKIGESFLRDLMKWHAKHGMKAIEQVGRKKPEELLRIMASLIPKHDIVEVGHHLGSPTIDLQELERRSFELLARITDGTHTDARQD